MTQAIVGVEQLLTVFFIIKGLDLAGASVNDQHMMLQMHAPLLLRVLHERDVRRTFCSLALWLGSHSAAEQAGLVEPDGFVQAAVVRALSFPHAAAARWAIDHPGQCGVLQSAR